MIVLQCENSILYDRLAKRWNLQLLAGTGPSSRNPCHLYAVRREYTERKLTENIECEIMHVVVEEAYESYRYVMPVFALCNHWVAACARWSYALGHGLCTQR